VSSPGHDASGGGKNASLKQEADTFAAVMLELLSNTNDLYWGIPDVQQVVTEEVSPSQIIIMKS
jgi:hypothetical protein